MHAAVPIQTVMGVHKLARTLRYVQHDMSTTQQNKIDICMSCLIALIGVDNTVETVMQLEPLRRRKRPLSSRLHGIGGAA